MGAAVGQEAWQELIGRMVVQKRRLVEFREYESDTRPNPGASEERLRAAELRLGRPLDPQYRELLAVADGWDYFDLSYSLLGTEDIGAGARWASGLMQADIWFDDEEWAEEVGAPNDPAQYQLVVENDIGYAGNIFLFAGQATRLVTGAAVPLPPEMTYPDLFSFFSAELDSMIAEADQATLGEYSEPWWGRNLRTHPPTLAEIVAKIAELHAIGRPDTPPPLHPGATDYELALLHRNLGGCLHPEHRELLSVSNGLSTPYHGVGDILSVQEILDGARWRDMLARKQIEDDRCYRDQVLYRRDSDLPDPEPLAPVAERIGYIPAVPFAISGSDPQGIDTRDGHVRDLLMDVTVSRGAHRTSAGTVRAHLLHACWRIWWEIGCPSGECGR
ncbi:SMI1/KNR4 family protein [Nocardia sp. XZ_19_385]|uniref:SMI1/KNR4 family protein n=1 Tax=Nocardia sp. XZ_19_385 TaxID=2769488 RepID=UPI001890990E|nr:SMI1/KNR4 family protein [Nocardia sp. XZ_19_385]